MRSQRDISIGERIAAVFFGAAFGAVIGAIFVWLFGVYSQSMGPGLFVPDASRWIMGSSAIFAIIGLVTGSHVGTAVGMVFAAIYEAERQGNDGVEVPTWLALVLVLAIGIGVYWWASR